MMKKYALILNPAAGRGRGKKLTELIIKKTKDRMQNLEVFPTQFPGHAKEIAQRLKSSYEVIVAAGGDGTVHEIVNGMLYGKAALAVLPIGSGNDFIKMLNIPAGLDDSIDVILKDSRKNIDVGKVGDRYFPNGLGIGFDAWVVKESARIKRLRGFLIYLYSVMKTVFSYRNEKITFHIGDREEFKDIFLIAIGNGKAMGGGFFLTPEAQIDDGVFDVCIIHALKKREVFLNLPKAISGNHIYLKQVEMLKSNHLHIRSQNGIAAHADGELLGLHLKNLDISIVPKALEVVHSE